MKHTCCSLLIAENGAMYAGSWDTPFDLPDGRCTILRNMLGEMLATDTGPGTPTPKLYGLPPLGNVPGAKAYALRHDSNPYIVQFPAQVFMLSGTRQKMEPVMAKAAIVRIEMNDRVVAYSYGLIPVSAHKKLGEWVIDSEAGCIFYATFIDDKGDEVFRDLIPAPFTVDVVPGWVKQSNH